jgi:hypothetical protein
MHFNPKDTYGLLPLVSTLRRYLLMAMLGLFPVVLVAQKRIVHGVMRDSATHLPLANASVTNENARKTVTTTRDGRFTILVTFNDLLFFNAPGYRFDTLHCNRILPDTVYVDMVELNTLQGVTVTTTTRGYSQYQKDSMRRRENFYADIGGPRTKTLSKANSGAGIGINLDRFFKKKEKAKRTAIGDFEDYEKESYINYRFSPEIVQLYSGLRGDTLQTFMNRYRPDYKWLREHPTDEDILYYVNDKLKEFLHRKENQ